MGKHVRNPWVCNWVRIGAFWVKCLLKPQDFREKRLL